jgi:drug/metabolite transporter (DMT)-like permease
MNRLHDIASRPAAAAFGLAIGGLFWGLYWVPLRVLSDLGMGGAWPGAFVFFGAAILLTPLIWHRRAGLRSNWWALVSCGLLTGAAFSLFSTAIILTDVVRAILLFYLTPVWSTLLGLVYLGERLTPARIGALALGITGMLIMLGLGAGWPVPRSLGDILALASGMVWAVGSLRLYQARHISVVEQVIAFVTGGLVIALATVAIGGAVLNPIGGAPVFGAAIWPLAIISLFVVPTLFLTVWPATVLPPARVGLILMTEIIAGVISAALFAGEVFGWREAVGSLMIVSAGLVEVLGHRVSRAAIHPEKG